MDAKHASILSAVLGSLCCVGPLLFIALGLGTGAAVIGRYHWFFIIAAMAVLTWSWIRYLRAKTVCDCERRPMDGRRSSVLSLLVATVIVLGFAGLNISRYVFASSPASRADQVADGRERIVLRVEGMSCATCEIAVHSALQRVDGVASADVSVATNTATIDFDPRKTSLDQLVAAINSTGYRASVPRK